MGREDPEIPAMKVLQVTNGIIWGGGEKYVLLLLEAFKNRPIDMSLAVFSEGRLSSEARKMGVQVHMVPKRFRGDPRPLFRLAGLIGQEGIDIVHTHLLSGNIYGRLAGKLRGVKGIVSTAHHADKGATGFRSPVVQGLVFHWDIRMASLCDRVIATSTHLKRLLVQKGIPEQKSVSIVNGLNLARVYASEVEKQRVRRQLGLAEGVKVVGTVGRLVPVKNFPLFLRAARRVVDSGIKAQFVLVGSGPLRGQLEQDAAHLDLSGQLIFAGFQENVFPFVALFDLFVLSSNSETSCFVVSEAMALGKPVIATSVGGVPELIDHGRDGWLCSPHDEVSLAEAMISLLQDERQAQELGRQAARRVREQRSLRTMANQVMAVYQQLMTERRLKESR